MWNRKKKSGTNKEFGIVKLKSYINRKGVQLNYYPSQSKEPTPQHA
jgi:hypothetical protein